MKIAFFETEAWEQNELQKLNKAYTIQFTEEPLTAVNVDQYTDVDVVSPFIYSKLGSDVLKRFQHLRFITTRSTGYATSILTSAPVKLYSVF